MNEKDICNWVSFENKDDGNLIKIKCSNQAKFIVYYERSEYQGNYQACPKHIDVSKFNIKLINILPINSKLTVLI